MNSICINIEFQKSYTSTYAQVDVTELNEKSPVSIYKLPRGILRH